MRGIDPATLCGGLLHFRERIERDQGQPFRRSCNRFKIDPGIRNCQAARRRATSRPQTSVAPLLCLVERTGAPAAEAWEALLSQAMILQIAAEPSVPMSSTTAGAPARP